MGGGLNIPVSKETLTGLKETYKRPGIAVKETGVFVGRGLNSPSSKKDLRESERDLKRLD